MLDRFPSLQGGWPKCFTGMGAERTAEADLPCSHPGVEFFICAVRCDNPKLSLQ
jgi:hypothetical protein